MMRLKIIGCLLSMGLCLGGGVLAQGQPNSFSEKINDSLAAKLTTLREDEEIKVIVSFNIPESFRDGIANGRSLEERRKAVAAGRAVLFKAMNAQQQSNNRGVPSGVFEILENSPVIYFKGNRSEIQALSRNPAVQNMFANERMKPLLDISTSTIGMPALWAEGIEGSGQAVAIIDSGVQTSHPFFAGRIVAEACFSENEATHSSLCPNGQEQQIGPGAGVNCDTNIDGCFHGTHVAGIAAGANGPGFDGVARGASIIAIQVYAETDDPVQCNLIDSTFSAPCAFPTLMGIGLALNHVANLTATIDIAAVNLSLGDDRGNSTTPCNSGIDAVADTLRALGVAVIGASGNNRLSNAIASPACSPSVISVGATIDSTDDVWLTIQPNQGSNSASFLDLLAPGAGITSSVPTNGYTNYAGTSQAAPHVAGAFAVLKAAHPNKSVDQILAALKESGEPIADPRNGITFPRIDVAAAHELLSKTPFAVVPINGFSLIPTSAP